MMILTVIAAIAAAGTGAAGGFAVARRLRREEIAKQRQTEARKAMIYRIYEEQRVHCDDGEDDFCWSVGFKSSPEGLQLRAKKLYFPDGEAELKIPMTLSCWFEFEKSQTMKELEEYFRVHQRQDEPLEPQDLEELWGAERIHISGMEC
jgi:hypothetical protein